MNNPFSLIFSRPPAEFIDRGPQADRIISEFTGEYPVNQINMITGLRGAGKTVFMTDIAKRLKEKHDWICIDLNPERDLLSSFAAKLNSESRAAKLFRAAKIDLSFLGIGIGIEGAAPVTDLEDALMKMLTAVKKNGKKILVTIDEATNTRQMREFVSAYSIFIRNELPVFLIMTGLYKNIDSIRNADPITFLERAPRSELGPLDAALIAERYMDVLGITQEKAVALARESRGYPFAFQVIGYYAWEDKDDLEGVMRKSRRYLEEYAYSRIWSELSKKDREVATACAMVPTGEISEIRQILDMSSDQFNPYRMRLVKAGIISGRQRGVVTFELPGFDEFVLKQRSI